MRRSHFIWILFPIAATFASTRPASAQDSGPSVPSALALPTYRGDVPPPPPPGGDRAADSQPAQDSKVKPLVEGPLHEAFLSPAKDLAPKHVTKAPPREVEEHPAVDPPSERAEWIPGYWEWNDKKGDYLWVTGTWRIPPPGRFWVNGYWKRDADGWFRVPGFWSDRKIGRASCRERVSNCV